MGANMKGMMAEMTIRGYTEGIIKTPRQIVDGEFTVFADVCLRFAATA